MTENQRITIDAFLDSSIGQQIAVRRIEALSRHCTLRIGGDADYLLTPTTAESLCALLFVLRQAEVRYFLLGKGSNVLFDDGGYRGVIVQMSGLNRVTIQDTTIIAQAGATVNAMASAAEKAGLTGMEFLFGIPGSVGGAVYMNAGAYDGEVSQILTQVRCMDRQTGEHVVFSAQECALGYRHSQFMEKKWVILEVEFSLQPGNPPQIHAKMEELMRRRAEKQPLNYPSAGSTFKRYPGRFTAQMIDEAGLKGIRVGGAQVSEKHAGFLINRENATSADMRALIDLVRDRVEQVHGVRIEREVEFVPEKEGMGKWS